VKVVAENGNELFAQFGILPLLDPELSKVWSWSDPLPGTSTIAITLI
jgi:hypothetical protein